MLVYFKGTLLPSSKIHSGLLRTVHFGLQTTSIVAASHLITLLLNSRFLDLNTNMANTRTPSNTRANVSIPATGIATLWG